MPRLVDAHSHLEDISDLDGALRRAVDAGVAAIITVGSDYNSCRFALDTSKNESYGLRIYPALGIHPWSLVQDGTKTTLNFIESKIGEAVGIGEVGLDYWYKEVRKNREKKRLQQDVFHAFLDMAKRYDKPIIIHSRGAWKDCVEMTIDAEVKKVVFHWFTGPEDTLERLLEHGYFVSATPAAHYSKEHRRVIEKTPLEYLLLETDSPVKYQGLEAEPAHVVKSLSAVARLKGIGEKTVADRTTENASRVFGLDM